MVGLDPSVMSLVMKPCCHDTQMPFGQLLKQACGCLDWPQMVGLDSFVLSPVFEVGVDGVTGPFASESCKEATL
ncbi:hypothetical protein CFP56_024632 [Quercus suber]|uniref:Uncharacterized protein n=1 Tax=Quercus suber TaxID=58331 RepID=A0AAW0K822_QUESU